jgi:hypothetical protein
MSSTSDRLIGMFSGKIDQSSTNKTVQKIQSYERFEVPRNLWRLDKADLRPSSVLDLADRFENLIGGQECSLASGTEKPLEIREGVVKKAGSAQFLAIVEQCIQLLGHLSKGGHF